MIVFYFVAGYILLFLPHKRQFFGVATQLPGMDVKAGYKLFSLGPWCWASLQESFHSCSM
ncbi:MAG: hypothetical protein WBW71_11515 [Bacteroidota bacterium]